MHASNIVSNNILHEFGGESKSAKMACAGFLTACFVNNDYVTVELAHSTAHARPRFSLGRGLGSALAEASPRSPGCGCVGATLEWRVGYVIRGYVMALLWLCWRLPWWANTLPTNAGDSGSIPG